MGKSRNGQTEDRGQKRTAGGLGKDRLRLLCPLFLLILAILHYLDAKKGAVNCGDLWLVSRYLMVVGAALGLTILAGALLFSGKLRLETAFLPLALGFGLVYLYVFPPLSAPDEMSHYISAYQLSSRLLGLASNAGDGHVLVREEDWFLEDSQGDYKAFVSEEGFLRADQEGAKDAEILGQTLTEDTYRQIHEKWADRGTVGERLAVSIHPPVRTTPLAYVAPALGISLARLFGLGSLWLLYLGRLGNLLLFAVGISAAMRRLPFGKEILFGVSLLPMSLHLAASFSYDVTIFVGLSLFTAECLHLAFRADRVRPGNVLFLAGVMAVFGPCKMVYAVFMGLCLLIPVRKFGGWGKWFLSACCVLGAWTAAMAAVNGQVVVSYVTETEPVLALTGEAGYSFSALIHQRVKCIQLFYNTLLWQGDEFHLTLIGAWLGNLDPVLDVPYLVVWLFTGGLVGLSLRKPQEQLILVGGRRVWIWVLCLGCVGATMFSMLLACTPASSSVIIGVQGRYFLPFLPVFLMTFKNDSLVLTRGRDREILYLMCCANAFILFRIFSIVCMRL